MMGKIVKYLALGIAFIIAGRLASALLYRAWLQHRVVTRRAIRSARGIQSLDRVHIGGIDQWIEVRGEDVSNPILLFIHGGPGVAFIPLAGSFQGPWEKHFTVVQWDQRGAGKTYTSNDKELQHRTMSVVRMEQDALDIVNYLRVRFHRRRIFVLAHSWGSVPGLWLAHEHSDLLYAFVGVGQVIDSRRNEAVAYQDAFQEAHRLNRPRAIQALEAIAPYPGPKQDFQKESIAHGWEEFVLGRPPRAEEFVNVRRLLLDLISAPEYSLLDDYNFIRGRSRSVQILVPQLDVDMTRLGPEFQVPIFFFEGGHDAACRPSLVHEYMKAVHAPHKELVSFDSAGHFPFFEAAADFTDHWSAGFSLLHDESLVRVHDLFLLRYG